MSGEISIGIAFVAGLLSFASPCVLPLLPAFLAYLSGISATDLKKNNHVDRKTVFLNTLFFVGGFSLVFSLIGVLLNSILLSNSFVVNQWLSWIGGVIIIIFGLFVLGLLNIPFLQQEHKIHVQKKDGSFFSSFLFGSAFAAGWSPCIGVILGSILTLAITQPATSFSLLIAYTLGLGLPFLIAGALAPEALNWLAKHQSLLRYFNLITGIVLIILGILVFTGELAKYGNLLTFAIEGGI